ncbi:MAG: hypothetical protein LBQ36_05665 [Synergistaceae bacterium]|jgi:hypothetical protein|nr:hypothetical protein [Synergistaceae bacterium]
MKKGASKLKLFVQGGFCHPGCCGVVSLRSTDGTALYSDPEGYRIEVGKLLAAVKDRYGRRVDVSVVNSWGMLALWDVLRLKITPSVPTWVMEGKKICEGTPEPGELLAAIDAELGA